MLKVKSKLTLSDRVECLIKSFEKLDMGRIQDTRKIAPAEIGLLTAIQSEIAAIKDSDDYKPQ